MSQATMPYSVESQPYQTEAGFIGQIHHVMTRYSKFPQASYRDRGRAEMHLMLSSAIWTSNHGSSVDRLRSRYFGATERV